MPEYPFDLHIHSCLSPCAENSSTPADMAGMFALSGYKVVALTDHNSCGNCAPFLEACSFYGMLGIPGMELCTSEEVHVICLFESLEGAMDFSSYVREGLPKIKNRRNIFGKQLYADNSGGICEEEDTLLISAASIGIYSVCSLVSDFGGFAYPAHLDRSSESLISNLGFWDPAMGFTMAEISAGCPESFAKGRPDLAGVPLIRGSDAHRFEQIPQKPLQAMELSELSRKAAIDWLRALKSPL